MKRIVIVDYGLGNLRSVFRGLEKSGAVPKITADSEEISSAEGIVLPGVGAFRDGMEQLFTMREAITEASAAVPVLGICLGMQMLLEWSEEHGRHAGLGIIPGTVRRFPKTPGFKIPHMGWNTLHIAIPDHPLMAGVREGSYVYFVHSFYADTALSHTLTTTRHICPFCSAVTCGMVQGVQFHPEKSGPVGLKILENFIDLV
jgi:glutamine amidotransferase